MRLSGNWESVQRRWRCGEFVIDAQRRRLLRSGIPVDIEERTFDLIVLLAAQHQRAVDRREIMEALWGSRPVSDNTLRQVVYKARQALGDDGRRQAVIRTLHGRSLRWVALLDGEPMDRQQDLPPLSSEPGAAIGNWRRWQRSVALFGFSILLLFIGLTALLLRGSAPDPQPQPSVSIGPIINATGDAALDWTRSGLPKMMAGLLDDDGFAATSSRSNANAHVEKDFGGELPFTANEAATVVDGRLRKLDRSTYELDLRVQAPQRAAEEIRIAGDLPGTLAADAVSRLRRALVRFKQPLLASPQAASARRPLATR